MTSMFGKSTDQKDSCHVPEFTKFCNDQIFKEHSQIDKHFVFQNSDTQYYVKQDYLHNDTTPQENLELPMAVCQ